MADRKTYVHVNQHVFRRNLKEGTNDPAITIKNGRENTYCRCVRVKGPVRIEYSGNEKTLLSCGARVAITTRFGVDVDVHAMSDRPNSGRSIRILRDAIRSNKAKGEMQPVLAVVGSETELGYGAWIDGDVVVRQFMEDGRLSMTIETDSPVTTDKVAPEAYSASQNEITAA